MSLKTSVFFVDLDDTLFHTRRKAGPEPLEAVAFGRDGAPMSYMGRQQRALFDWLCREGRVVPTTGRDQDALSRVRLPFSAGAICSFGGLILGPDGRPEPRWQSRIADLVTPHTATLAELTERALEHRHRGVRARVIADDGLDLYVSVKHEADDAATLAEVAEALRPAVPAQWALYLHDNNLAFLPPGLGKHHAVRWFRETLVGEPHLAIGVGDSLSDREFLAACDFALMPSRSQLFRALERA